MREHNISVIHLGTEISHSSAPLRIHNAVKEQGIDSRILTMRKNVSDSSIDSLDKTFLYKVKNKLTDYHERHVMNQYPDRSNLPFSFGRMGMDVSNMESVKNADIIHLHWINGQFLSFDHIARLGSLQKPIVWTFHDSWPMTGGCHVRYGCQRFEDACGCCPMLGSDKEYDITKKIIESKKAKYPIDRIITVAPSNWMNDNIKKSIVFQDAKHVKISNPFDLSTFSPMGKLVKKDDRIKILFGASGAMELPYKGYEYFAKAMQGIRGKYPAVAERIVIQLFGSNVDTYPGLEGYTTEALGFIKSDEEMAKMYSNADLYVFPSLDDNLPGTVIECLSCETPVVGFKTCGVPEIINHKENGYLAAFKDVDDLVNGIIWVITNNEDNVLGENGRVSMKNRFDQELIGRQYADLYKDIMESWK